MSIENPLWGAPRIHGELLKLGFEVAQSSVAKYMIKRRGPPSQGWRTFLRNHAPDIAAMDLFVVPTLGFDLLYAFIIIRLDRRDLVWINVTTHPTAEWIARQITEAFPWNEAPHYLIRDRDRIYGSMVTHRLRAMGIRDKPIAPASPWQNSFAERLIGSIRRECVDHFVVLGEAHLRRILQTYACYYNNIRTHRSLDKDAPVSRPVQPTGSIKSTLSLADFITIMFEFRFWHTAQGSLATSLDPRSTRSRRGSATVEALVNKAKGKRKMATRSQTCRSNYPAWHRGRPVAQIRGGVRRCRRGRANSRRDWHADALWVTPEFAVGKARLASAFEIKRGRCSLVSRRNARSMVRQSQA